MAGPSQGLYYITSATPVILLLPYMNIKKIDRDFFDLAQSLQDNEQLRILACTYPVTIDESSRQALVEVMLPDSLVVFLQSLNGLQLQWENRVQETSLIMGSLKILPAKEMVKNWNELIYFDDNTSAGQKHFYPVDFFAEEACCGVFAGGDNDSLHYYAFSSGDEPYNLHLNMADYVCLAIKVKCYRYWPLIVKLITEKADSPMTRKFRDDMAELFPAFSVEKFMKMYEELKR